MFAEENKDTKLMNELFWSFGTTQLSLTDVEVFNEVSVRSTGMQASVRINTKTNDECRVTNTLGKYIFPLVSHLTILPNNRVAALPEEENLNIIFKLQWRVEKKNWNIFLQKKRDYIKLAGVPRVAWQR